MAVPDHLRYTWNEMIDLLRPYNVSPIEAVRAHVEILEAKRVAQQVTYSDAVLRFIKSKEREKSKQSYIRDIKTRLDSFDFLNDELLESVSHIQFVEDLEDREIGAVNWNNNVRNLRVFFAWCMNQQPRIISHNPALQLETQKVDEEEVEILEVSQTRKVLKTAMETPELRRQVPWFVLGMFCGMRKDEADRAEWGDIDWETNTIKVRSAKLRSMSTRYVELTEPAKSFFKLLQNGERMVVGRHARWADIKLLSEKTGLELNKNLYRHSYGSYHLATYESAHKTMGQMGHSNLKTFVDHYRRPIPKIIAEAYWQISPTNLG